MVEIQNVLSLTLLTKIFCCFWSSKGPTEASLSLHKQCEIQRECVRYTKGLAVKHLGFLTEVMLGEQT